MTSMYMCRLCGSSMAYSHHRVALFGKKVSQERLASRISALLDITNDDDGLPNLRYQYEVQAESWKFRDGDDRPHEVEEVSSCAAI